MALHPCEGAEPIAGYRLVERLGTGGYGEVWKATAPGGLTKAIKLVYGHMQDVRAEQELKALSRIREVRHPFLLSLERFEIVAGQLIIVTELADMSLQDHYEACRKKGLRGISREELLVCIRDAADALDYMSEQFGLQHLDIKPQNLLLVGGRVKVADFGLVKNLQGSSATATGGVTPIYASPEAFDGRVSKYSDQYSLAIVYQEMLTGVRPFPGATPLQLAMQHTHSPPGLDPLPARDRGVIARALSKTPDQRFPTCRAMSEQLFATSARSTARTVAAPPSPPVDAAATSLPNSEEMMGQVTSLGSAALARDVQTVVRGFAATTQPKPDMPSGEWPSALADLAEETDPLVRGLRPTLFVGVGGLACAALRRLRGRLLDRFGSLSAVPILRTLLVDTDRATFRQGQGGFVEPVLDTSEILFTPLRKPEQYRAQSRELLRWLDRRWLYGIPRSLLTEGMRPLGRLALVDNANELLTRLRVALSEIIAPEAMQAAVSASGLGIRDETPRVFLIASISGGTGGGMLVDVAYLLRQVLRELHLPDEDVCGVLLHATSQKPTGKELACVNAYATLTELNHFCTSGIAYPGDLRNGLKAFPQNEPPLREGYVLHLGDDLDEASANVSTDHLAEFLYLNAVTTAGGYFEEPCAPPAGSGAEQLYLRTFGMARVVLPRYRLAETAGNQFCQLLVKRWRGTFNTAEDDCTELDAFQKSAATSLEVDTIAGHLYTAASDIWREEPKAHLQAMLENAFGGQTLQRGEAKLREVCNQVLAEMGRMMGFGRATAEADAPKPTDFEVAMHDRALELSEQLGRSVVEWFVGLVEDPRRRLIKAADQAARWFMLHLFTVGETLAADLERLRAHREATRVRLAAGDVPAPEPTGNRWFGLRAKQPALDPQPWFLEYGLLRLRELALENTLFILQHVHGQVTAFTLDVARSLEKLRHFGDHLLAPTLPQSGMSNDTPVTNAPPVPTVPLPNVKELLPEKAKTLERAAEALFDRVSPNIMDEFETCLQTEVFNPLGGLWSIISGPRDLDVVLKDVVRKRARAAMLDALRETDAARLFLENRENPLHLPADLKFQTEVAAPLLPVPADATRLVALMPGGAAGTVLRDLLAEIIPASRTTVLESEGDVVFCRQSAPLALPAVARIVVGNRMTYVEAAQKVLTRTDVNWTALRSSEPSAVAAAR